MIHNTQFIATPSDPYLFHGGPLLRRSVADPVGYGSHTNVMPRSVDQETCRKGRVAQEGKYLLRQAHW